MQIQLENNASPLFKACCLFYPRLSVSLWVLTNVLSLFMLLKLYVYTDMVLVVMQWKPANKSTSKSQSIVITLPVQNRWPLIFRHEFIQLIYLRENGLDSIRYRRRQSNFIPEILDNQCSECGLQLSKERCSICDSNYMYDIKKRIREC